MRGIVKPATGKLNKLGTGRKRNQLDARIEPKKLSLAWGFRPAMGSISMQLQVKQNQRHEMQLAKTQTQTRAQTQM